MLTKSPDTNKAAIFSVLALVATASIRLLDLTRNYGSRSWV